MSLKSVFRFTVLLMSGAPAVLFQAAQAPSVTVQQHPLDPLTADEINAAGKVLRAAPQFPADALFATIVLKEPSKSDVLAYKPGAAIARQAFAVILDRPRNRTFEAVVDVTHVPRGLVDGGQRRAAGGARGGVRHVRARREGATRAGRQAMRKRGIDEFDQGAGRLLGGRPGRAAISETTPASRRLLFQRGTRPISTAGRSKASVALVDMNAEQGRRVRRHRRPCRSRRRARSWTRNPRVSRTAPKPLTITQPDGPSFTITGQEIRWQKWRFRYTMHPREGLVLHTVGYEDDGRRAADPLPRVALRDGGAVRRPRSELALAQRLRRRRIRHGPPGELRSSRTPTRLRTPRSSTPPSRTTTASRTSCSGRSASTSATAACCGSTTSRSRRRTSRAARAQLVIFFIATIGNYDYAINWIFHQDGVLELDAALTGIMLPKGVRGRESRHASPGVRPSRRGQRRRAAPPALLQLQARLRRRRPGQLGARDEHARAAGGARQSVAQRHVMEETMLAQRSGGATRR